MNTVWSDQVQGIQTLYTSRRLRFSDEFREAYQKAFSIGPEHQKILEVGCGPGALAQALDRWYPGRNITGVDLDTSFIRFAARQAPHLRFLEADATCLPFEEGSFDVTISNTVQEHLPPELFFGQQYRVLRPGGVCLVLSSRRGIQLPAPCLAQTGDSDWEAQIWQRVERSCQNTPLVGQYWMNESQLPAAMEQHGFRQVSAHYLTVSLTPDSWETPPERALDIIESYRQNDLEAVNTISHTAPGLVSEAELARLRQLVDQKYDRRIQLYQAGEKQWDTMVSVILVMRGIK